MDVLAQPPIPEWKPCGSYRDIVYAKADEGIAKIAINRPQVRNAFRPETVVEMQSAFADARDDPDIGVVVLTGEGREAFCSGGDQRVRGKGGNVGSDDGGYGAAYMARIVGQKKAREIWFLCRQYDAQQALDMGLVNRVVPYEELEAETVRWCREMLANSPIALRCLKAALNADCDGQAGLQELAGNATLLYYLSEEGKEGKNAFLEKRKPDFRKFKRLP